MSHKFKNIELYIAGGLKVKSVKYSCLESWQAKEAKFSSSANYQSKKKTHFVPVLGCGINIPFKNSWFVRGEYNFEFPVKLSLQPAETQQRHKFGCERIKHNVHNIRVGIGKMF
ncbi:MAG: hypothetical protein IJ481_03625 [Alphaproteobacteria bacterium]|nr:hypothetical protein [Alphaproteobacteria bacterium]